MGDAKRTDLAPAPEPMTEEKLQEAKRRREALLAKMRAEVSVM